MTDVPHPAILALGNSLDPKATFPLIMVVGREPNNEHTTTEGIGRYKFWPDGPLDTADNHTMTCAFWNTAYSVMARALELSPANAGAAKLLCKPMRLSPLIFSDAMPRGLANRVPEREKNEFRAKISAGEVRQHVEHVFSHSSVISRVKLVLLSGHDVADSLKRASTMFEEGCRAHRIPWQRVPFMYGTNMSKIMKALSPKEISIIREVWSALPQPAAAK